MTEVSKDKDKDASLVDESSEELETTSSNQSLLARKFVPAKPSCSVPLDC